MAASGTGTASSGNPETENCSDIRLLLSALVDNEASPDEAVRAKAHMVSCDGCASHFAFLRVTGRAMSQIPDVYPAASLSARIAAATYDKPTFAERIAGWLRPVPVRVALGAALATGLAMVFIVPRISEVDTAAVSPAPVPAERGVSAAKDKPAVKEVAKAAKPTLSVKPANVPAVSVPKPVSAKPETTVASNLPPVKLSSVPVSAPTPKSKAAPVMMAKAYSSQNLQSLEGASANLSASDIVRTTRTGPQMDRNRNLRAFGNGLKKPGTGNILLPRSGYDRAAETEGRLKPREIVASAAPSTSVVPNISPLLPENNEGRLAEPTTAIAERNIPRSPANTVVALQPGNLQLHIKTNKPDQSVAIPTSGVSHVSNSSAGDRYSFGAGSAARISISSAPVTGSDR